MEDEGTSIRIKLSNDEQWWKMFVVTFVSPVLSNSVIMKAKEVIRSSTLFSFRRHKRNSYTVKPSSADSLSLLPSFVCLLYAILTYAREVVQFPRRYSWMSSQKR